MAAPAHGGKEERQLQTSIDILVQRVAELRNKIEGLILRLEREPPESLNWPSFLDNFAIISSQINTLTRFIKNEKTIQLKSYELLPLSLNPNIDENLRKLTNGRVHTFNHELVPDYLRTKPEPEVEERGNTLTAKAITINTDVVNKQMASLNNAVHKIAELIEHERERFEADINQRTQTAQSYRQKDTEELVASIMYGKGISANRAVSQVTQPPQVSQPQTMQNQIPNPSNAHMYQQKAIKTNIRGSNPYNRPQ
ncbi:DgyrCDS577 [Dimorphilus gyrociliatus]|uniref:Mediator of RNA polymerase II transcription subunit 8 n=1 Tax=Dimorphilus gyrociliatus TaxID=2664684 RepID=A0A7I8V7U2_9ANNE|nr:DgyrCDS577 [Dimorphilus gyrociliatus]